VKKLWEELSKKNLQKTFSKEVKELNNTVMKTIVTGATGLLGCNVVIELLNRGHHVKILTRPNSNISMFLNRDIEINFGNLEDEEFLYKSCCGYDNLIHAAANTHQFPIPFSNYENTNFRGTQNMVNAAVRANISRIVHIGTCSSFGYGTKVFPATELFEFEGFKFGSGYINSKFLTQQWILSETTKKQLPIIVVNPTHMIGPNDARPSSGRIIIEALKHKLQFCPPGGKNYIDVRDAAIATCNALTIGTIGECYLLASKNMRFKEFYNKINDVIGHAKKVLTIPKSILNTMGIAGSIYQLLSKKQIELNYTNSRLICLESYYSGQKAVDELRLPQSKIETAIRDALDWFIKNGYVKDKIIE